MGIRSPREQPQSQVRYLSLPSMLQLSHLTLEASGDNIWYAVMLDATAVKLEFTVETGFRFDDDRMPYEQQVEVGPAQADSNTTQNSMREVLEALGNSGIKAWEKHGGSKSCLSSKSWWNI